MTTLVPNSEFARLASDEQIATAVAALTARGMAAEAVESGAEARSRVLDLLPEGAEVFTSMSRTLDTLGLSVEINESSRYHPLRPQLKALDRQTQGREWRRLQSSPEYVVGSVHAVTEQGQVLIASASGSQLASYVFGADHVIWVAGAQKSCATWARGSAACGNIAIRLRTSVCMPSMGLAASWRKFSWSRLNGQAASRLFW